MVIRILSHIRLHGISVISRYILRKLEDAEQLCNNPLLTLKLCLFLLFLFTASKLGL